MRSLKASIFFFLFACSVGPKYKEPTVLLKPDFKNEEGQPQEASETIVALNKWWDQFQDPILSDLIDQSIQKNYDLQTAFERIRQVRAFYNIQNSRLFPTVDFNGSFERYATSQNLYETPYLGPRVQNLFLLGFDVEWEIDLFGRLRNLKQAAYADLFAAKEDYRSFYITIIADVARNYTLYSSYYQQIQNLKKQVEIQKELANLYRSLAKAGLDSWDPFFASRALVRALEAKIPPVETQMQYALNRIAVLIGEDPESFQLEKTGPILMAKGKVPLGMPSDLLRRRPDIRMQERELAAATHRTAAAVADFFPTFSLSGNYGWGASRFYKWFRPESSFWSIMPGLTQPLINFGRIQAQVDLKRAEQKEVFYRYQGTILKALEEVENTLFTYMRQEVKILTLESEVKDLKENAHFAQNRFDAGLSPFIEALKQELNVLAVDYEIIVGNQILSESLIALYKSLGGDWECSTTP